MKGQNLDDILFNIFLKTRIWNPSIISPKTEIFWQ